MSLEKLPRIIALLAIPFISSAQLFYNNGGIVHADVGGIVYVDGALTNDNSGNLENFGQMTIKDDVTLSNTSVASGDGDYYVAGDWINDATFNADLSEVILDGDNQMIDGSVITNFYDITLTGTGVKTQDIDATCSGVLDLTDRELATESFYFYVDNPAVMAVTRTTGFVSSLTGGTFARLTAGTGLYLFPTGSTVGTTRYRPVEMVPQAANPNVYSVRLANNDATLDGYDRALYEASICDANEFYYHVINHDFGADDIDLIVYHSSAEDGDFTAIAQWEGLTTNQWESTGPALVNAGTLIGVEIQSWSDFSTDPYVLIKENPSEPTLTGNDVICGGGAAVYYASGDPSATFEWDVTGGSFADSDTTSSQVNVVWGSGSNGTVDVYQIVNGCKSTLPTSLPISLLAQPTALYNHDFYGTSVSNIAFEDSSIGNGLIYSWDFGDTETSTAMNPIHSYDEPGVYNVSLIVENNDGCLDTISKVIELEEIMNIPNIFTPNNDGFNDQFVAQNLGICDFSIEIYNRWGNLIFTSNNPSIAWDGKTRSGGDASSGTYYYKAVWTSCKTGESDAAADFITLTK